MLRRLLSLSVALAYLVRAADPLPVSTPEAEGFSAERFQRVYDLVEGTVREGRHAGASVLVARHGKIVGWKTFGSRDLGSGQPMEKDTVFRIYSMSKVVTAVAVLQLVEQGRIHLDSPVAKWLPELKDPMVMAGGTARNPVLVPATNAITVKMLLNHTAGFTYDFFAGSPVHELYKKADLWNSKDLSEFIGRVGRLPLLAQPGVAYNYGISDDILGVLVERVTGQAFGEHVRRSITEPLGMMDTGFDVPEDRRGRIASLHEIRDQGLATTAPILGVHPEPGRGIESGGAGLFSTVGDYARFAQCLLDDGQLDGRRILGRKTVELARMNSLPAGVRAFGPADGWGLFSAVRMDPVAAGEPVSEGTFFWSGAATTHFFVDPREKVVALVFCQHVPFDQHGLFTRFRTAVMQALE
jgi:CubicO group peptidase (beta-lactamase class C family)